MKDLIVAYEYDDLRIDRFLRIYFEKLSFSLIQKYLRKGLVKYNNKKVKGSTRIRTGQTLTYPSFFSEFKLESLSISSSDIKKSELDYLKAIILTQTKHLVVINKPYGLAVQGSAQQKQLYDYINIINYLYKCDARIIHRLDKYASGVLLLAKNRMSAKLYSSLFKQGKIYKEYIAVVKGKALKSETINTYLDTKGSYPNEKTAVSTTGKRAITSYNLLQYSKGISLLKITTLTGRKHQIRVHLASRNLPIIGDGKYGEKSNIFTPLHLCCIKILDPITKSCFSVSLAKHMGETVKKYGLNVRQLLHK